MDVSKFTPLNGRVLIQVDNEVEKMRGNIIIPDASQEKSNTGTVVKVHTESGLPIGVKVMYSKYSGTTIQSGKIEYKLILESDLLGIVE